MKILENVKIADLVTMKIGGLAKYLIIIEQIEDIVKAYDFVQQKQLPFFFLGSGANTFGKDEPYEGIIIQTKLKGITKINDQLFKVMSGEEWSEFVLKVSAEGYTGVEALAKIPGTVGAAPVQNIGAYGQEISDTLVSVEVFDFKTGELKVLKKEELKLSYRHSIFNFGADKGRYFIISISLKLSKGKYKGVFYDSLKQYIEEHHETDFSPKNIARMVTNIREKKLPDPKLIASSGSFFKNIHLTEKDLAKVDKLGIERRGTKINSGWLLEKAGLKGKVFHGMRVSEKAALILINESAKSYQDIELACQEIDEIIYQKFGFHLEREPVIIEN